MLADNVHLASVSSPSLRCTRQLLAPGVAVRLAARVARLSLDRALSDGADPAASRLLAARARQLSRASSRGRIARGLELLALSAEWKPSRARVLPSRSAARANRSALLDLATVLRGDRPVYAQGVAMLELVVIDGTGPAYTDSRGEAPARELQIARRVLLA